MASVNDFYTPEELASVALPLIAGDLKLAPTVSRTFEANFQGGVGYSVNVKRPNALKARTRNLPGAAGSGQSVAITSDSITEAVVSVVLDTEVYSSVKVTDAELSLEIEDFTRQVTRPQTQAIAQEVEGLIAAHLETVAPSVSVDLTSSTSVLAAFGGARSTFRKNFVPMDGLVAVMGVDAYAAVLDLDLVSLEGDAGASTQARTIRGFRPIEHNGIEANRIVFYHPAAFHLAVRAPMVPRGAVSGASVALDGFAARYVLDYDASTQEDRQTFTTYMGIQDLGVVQRAANGTTSVYVPAIAADADSSDVA
jgi:hypothetical protein